MLYNMYKFEKPTWWNEDGDRYDITFMRYCPKCCTDIVANWQIPDTNAEIGYITLGLADYLVTGENNLSYDEYKRFIEEYNIDCLKYREEIVDFYTMDTCPICGAALVEESNYHVSFTCHYIEGIIHYDANVKHNYIVSGTTKFPLNEQKSCVYLYPDEVKEISCNGKIFYHGFPMRQLGTNPAGRVALGYVSKTLESKIEYFRLLRKSQEEVDRVIGEELTQLYSCIDIPIPDDFATKEKIVCDKNILNQYLKNLLNVESNIYSLTERLKKLYCLRYDGKGFKYEGKLKIKEELKNAKKAYEDSLEMKASDTIVKENYIESVPDKLPLPVEPEQPILETPNFFNKKKVSLMNKEKEKAYEIEKNEYEKQMLQYQERCREIEKVNSKNEENINKYHNDLNEESSRIEMLQKEALKTLTEIQEKYNSDDEGVITPNMLSYQIVLDEISTAERTLKEAYSARNKLYSCDVIFEKYRNLIAISTFCEYLASGRCSALEGTDGAYNMYESELRANMIIGQLSQVIESLEKIQKNQYLLYSAISETNRRLDVLNKTMSKAVDELKEIRITNNDMRDQLRNIENNTAMTAYNTEVTAYYTKKNAELTNALGFMMALK